MPTTNNLRKSKEDWLKKIDWRNNSWYLNHDKATIQQTSLLEEITNIISYSDILVKPVIKDNFFNEEKLVDLVLSPTWNREKTDKENIQNHINSEKDLQKMQQNILTGLVRRNNEITVIDKLKTVTARRDRQAGDMCYVLKMFDGILKFGITSDIKNRLYYYNKNNGFYPEMHSLYTFDYGLATLAEKTCLEELECGIIKKSDLQDGYTETTSIQNLNKIIEIYERFGGVRVK